MRTLPYLAAAGAAVGGGCGGGGRDTGKGATTVHWQLIVVTLQLSVTQRKQTWSDLLVELSIIYCIFIINMVISQQSVNVTYLQFSWNYLLT